MSDTIRSLPYFAGLPDEIVDEVASGSEIVDLEPDAVIIEEGSSSEEMYVVIEGNLVVTKTTVDKEIELAHLGPGEVVGEMALLDGAPRTATVRAADTSRLIKVPVAAFEALLKDSNVVRRMFRTVTERLRNIEDTLRHEERMAALGRMAAQLMHELNNPAAAVARSTKELAEVFKHLAEESNTIIGSITDTAGLPTPQTPDAMSTFERADAEGRIEDWMASHGVANSWEIAPALAEAGWAPEHLNQAVDGLDKEMAAHLARWIGLRATAVQLGGEISIGATRISELVRVVKDYSYLDQAPVQEIDIKNGIADTLVLLKGKLRDIDVVLDFDEDLTIVEAPGRDVNQVWTNLIDNAAAAMGPGGTLTISARNEPPGVVVSIADTGGGIPPDVVDLIFDPFFTTKQPGEGTGLGLHTVHTIVTRLGGQISVASDDGGTVFTVRLPAASG